jgi:hypothetical protein
MSIDSPYLAFCVADEPFDRQWAGSAGIDKQGAHGSAIRQAGFKVAKSTSPCWLVNVIFLPMLLWCCCTPEMR